MSVRPGYADMTIDYTSLALFWSKLTDIQKKLIIHKQFDYLPDDARVKKESILIVWSKLTKAQKKLINCGFFHGIEIEGRVTRAQRERLLEIQDRHEKIVDQERVDKAKEAKRIKIKKKGPRGGTPPGPKAKWQTYKLAQKIGHSRCWYTNEHCPVTATKTEWSATREHIIPQAYGWNGKNRNTAIAAYFVNNLLGCAPIHVKMHVKNDLSKISCFPTLNGEQKKRIYTWVINNVLKQYRVCGVFPWDTSKGNEKVKMAYERHMTIQQNYVDNIRENGNNVRDYLEENCDGMETGFEQAHGLG